MLNKEKSGSLARFRILLVLPLIAGLLCTSTMAFSKDYAVIDLFPEKAAPQIVRQDTIKKVKVIKPKHLAPPPPAAPKKIRFPLPKPVKPATHPLPPPPPVEPTSHQVPPPPPVEPKPNQILPTPPVEPIQPSKNIVPEVSSVSGKKAVKLYYDNTMKMIQNSNIYDTPNKF